MKSDDRRVHPSFGVSVLKSSSVFFVLALCMRDPASAQLGHYVSRTTTLPDTTIVAEVSSISYDVGQLDIRSVGMGFTHLIESDHLASSLQNPALLARESGIGTSLHAIVSTPIKTIDAVSYVTDNEGEFEQVGGSLIDGLQAAYQDYQDRGFIDPTVAAKLQTALQFPQELFDQVVGNLDDPTVHGANINGGFRLRAGSFLFSFDAYGESGFAIYLSPVYQDLARLYTETDFTDTSEVEAALAEVRALLDQIVDPSSGAVRSGAIPALYGVTFSDIAGTIAYGFSPLDSLSVGVNLKLLNRKFALTRIPVDEASHLFQEITSKLGKGTTGLTGGFGALYHLPSGMKVALSVQNLIPFQELGSSYSFSFDAVKLSVDRDSSGNPVLNANGDTAWVLATRDVDVVGTSHLSLPVVMDVGISYPLLSNWDVALELTDVLRELTRYDDYGERIRLGTEYRLGLFEGVLLVAPRAGIAAKSPTFGLGLKVGGLFTMDAAYYPSLIENIEAVGLQLGMQF
jgi:hypothetical protein